MSDEPHPAWCSPRRCTAAVPPVNGHTLAAHRSVPEASGLTEAYLVQGPAAGAPSVEVVRSGRSVVLPLLEAEGLPAAIADLLGRAGVGR
ncbi:hypothetical protein ACFFX1_55685 [Dactylosporangium sucinum]|uniref:Uncharacterized protein n=1 Tax=Dactylosporangium sucinum TaxID=1424081 RepID=A0A917U372_9ACTN|nr:hypothetical protein [Dactylosporangium sucinum]GGM52180.1 hypothetical protein GCM10007977_062270 [Dactylosporangium sucinum]